jgi:hypothetical protein
MSDKSVYLGVQDSATLLHMRTAKIPSRFPIPLIVFLLILKFVAWLTSWRRFT